MEKITSSKGKQNILYEGYCYRLDRVLKSGKESCRCVNGKCKGRIHVFGDECTFTSDHDHVPDPAKSAASLSMMRLRERAATLNDAPRRIIQETQINLHPEVVAVLPKFHSLKRTAQRQRKCKGLPIPAPSNIGEIDIPRELAYTYAGENFLAYDSGSEDPDRYFIFATPDNLRLMKENKQWMGDGTFKIAPQLFYQLYVIHILYKGSVLPMVCILLQRKSEGAYSRALIRLLCMDNEIAPSSILCDYEKAFHKSFLSVFRNAEVFGCFFHLSQAVWRKIQDLGLTNLYCTKEEIRQYSKILVALAVVPPDDIINVFESLHDVIPDELDELVFYFEDTWIGIPCRRGRRDALFPPSVWSVYERVVSEHPPTNNS
ncbi:uncharacterized protein LOC135211117 [Macrobrachium nipponense]|uniref:uncharacterized protein LOC135211117 n=1 Tax=Macrobrachium nipponense TaxID=159736 RepID=UPI0030C86ED7